MGKKFTVGLAAMALMAVGVANAQQPVRLAQGIKVDPIRVAPISADGKIGKWVKYNPANGQRAAWQVAFDAFEADKADPNWPASLPSDNQYGADCAMGGSRWYFGPGYRNPYYSNDMTVATGTEGTMSEFLSKAWFWEVNEQCYIAVWTAEDPPTNSTPFGGGYNGVLYDFGVLPPGGGYYYTHIDLTGTGLGHQMPLDGRGSYQVFYANATSGGSGPGGLNSATMCQPMLWGTQGTNPSFQDEFQCDDDNPTNGAFDMPGEYYSYAYGVCPDPLGGMAAFYSQGGGGNVEEVCPASYTIMFGSLVSGGIADVCNSDDARMVFANGSTFLITQSPITVQYFGTTTISAPTEVKTTVEYSVSLVNLMARVDMRNYATSQWVQVDQRSASLTDEVVTASKTTDAADYVSGTGEVGIQVRVRDDAPAFLATWQGRYDQVKSTVTG